MAIGGFDRIREHHVFDHLRVFRAPSKTRPYKRTAPQGLSDDGVYVYHEALVYTFGSLWKAANEIGFSMFSARAALLRREGSIRIGHTIVWSKSAPIPEGVPNGLVFA